MVGLVFFDSVLPRLLFYYLVFSLPKMSRKNSLHVRSVVLGVCFFSLGFPSSSPFRFCFCCFFKRGSSGLTG